jgi:PH (Pleckstrin Homology) domain-containing protein
MLFVAGATMTYRERGWNWVSVVLACMTVVGVGGIIESLVLRVRLTDDALLVTDLRGRRRYDVTDIAGVHEAKGVPTAIQLADGRWVKLPSVGSSLGNSIRAWLKHHDVVQDGERMKGKARAIITELK